MKPRKAKRDIEVSVVRLDPNIRRTLINEVFKSASKDELIDGAAILIFEMLKQKELRCDPMEVKSLIKERFLGIKASSAELHEKLEREFFNVLQIMEVKSRKL